MTIDTGGSWKALGYISKMAVGRYGLLGAGFSGSDSTYYSDHAWANSSNNRVAFYGGGASHGSVCGAFACGLDRALSYSCWYGGASPSSNNWVKRKNIGDPKWVPIVLICPFTGLLGICDLHIIQAYTCKSAAIRSSRICGATIDINTVIRMIVYAHHRFLSFDQIDGRGMAMNDYEIIW